MPAKELKNELSWSHSRMRTFEECKRQYYFHYYLKWNGWKTTADAERQTAYRLSKMTSFDLETGNVVHDVIAEVLKKLRDTGIAETESSATERALNKWDQARTESLTSAPSAQFNKSKRFLEDYYGYPECEERSAGKREAIGSHLAGFYASKTWEQIQGLKTDRWRAMDTDPFEAQMVYDIPMHGRPDLALSSRGPKSIYRLFDWKTGRPRESDTNQLGFYALFAAKVWGCRPDAIVARLVYLKTPPHQVEVEVSEALINGSFETLTDSYRQMNALLKDTSNNVPLPIEHFPQSVSHRTCPRCNFQELCFGSKWEKSNKQPASMGEEVDDSFDSA